MTDTGSRDHVNDRHVAQLLARAGHLSEAQAAAFEERWPLPEPPDGDLILIHVPGRGLLATEGQIEAAHAAAATAVSRRAEQLGYQRSWPKRWLCALAAAQEAVVALMVRPREGQGDANWYLAHTETWREVVGDVHPDDADLETGNSATGLHPGADNPPGRAPNGTPFARGDGARLRVPRQVPPS